jgi:hypothetical protein
MGHQVNFFVMPADLPDLEAAVRAAGDVCFLADKSPMRELVQVDTIAAGPITGPPRPRSYFIAQRHDLPAVSTRFIKAQGYWLIKGSESPVIELSLSIFTGTRLTRGRAYFASDLRFRPELPSPDFVRWGDTVLARIKRKLTRYTECSLPSLYCGARAMEWIQRSGAIMTGGATAFTISDGGEDAVSKAGTATATPRQS